MRLEWGEAIRYRRWDVLETLAKKRPNQQLCDTVYELAQGIEEKQERRILKRILYILSQKGFEPSDYESEQTLRTRERPGRALMNLGFDQFGLTAFIYMGPAVKQVKSCMIAAQDWYGYIFQNFCDGPIENLSFGIKKLLRPDQKLEAEVDPAFAFWRCARAHQRRNLKDEIHGEAMPNWWRKIFEKAEPVDHPALALEPARTTPEEREQLWDVIEDLIGWRFHVMPQLEIWTDIHAIRWDPILSTEERNLRLERLLDGARKELLTDWFLESWIEHIHDLAYVLSIKGHPDALRILSLAGEVQQLGTESPFMRQLLRRSAHDVDELVEEDEFDLPTYAVVEVAAPAERELIAA
jgi:hypothetical protein